VRPERATKGKLTDKKQKLREKCAVIANLLPDSVFISADRRLHAGLLEKY
jgi:hypothetical protein